MAILTTRPLEKSSNGLTSGEIPGSGALTSLVLSTGVLQVDYFLEEHTNKGSTTTLVPLPSQPQNVEVRRIYSENTIYTFDPEYSFREVAAPRVVEVVLAGQTGVGLRLGINDDGELEYTNGYNHLASFEKFIDKYMHKAADHSSGIVGDEILLNRATNYKVQPYMVFRGIKENLHGRCSIKSLTYARSVDKNRLGSFTWQLTLMVYDAADASDPTGFGFMDWADDVTGFLNSLTGLSEAVMGGLQAGVGQIARDVGGMATAVTGLASSIMNIDNRVYGTIESIATNVNKVLDCFDAMSGVIDGESWKRDGVSFGDGIADQVGNAWNNRDYWDNEMVRATGKPKEAADDWDGDGSESVDFDTQSSALTMTEFMYQSWLLIGAAGADRNRTISRDEVTGFLNRSVAFGALSSLNKGPDYQPDVKRFSDGYSFQYEMRSGQSLLTIANDVMGDPSRWVDIANLNGMPDAYTKSDGTVLMSGDAILIPTAGGSDFSTFAGTEPHGAAAIIGTDIGFDQYGDIRIDYNTDNDFSVVVDIENLKATIERILKTTTGEVTMNPDYGLNFSIIGSAINETAVTMITVKIRERLLTDPRILDVTDIKASVDRDVSSQLNISLTCVCVGQNDIVVNTNLQTQ